MINKTNELKDNLKIKAWYPKVSDGDGSLLDSKFSGKPYLLPGEQYAQCLNCGKPMQLFIQLNLNTLPKEIAEILGSGLLQLFYCTSTEPCCDADCEANCAFESPPSVGKLIRIIHPIGDSQNYELPALYETYKPKCIIEWQLEDDYPDLFELKQMQLVPSDEWAQFVEEYGDFPLDGDKLGGYPFWIQGDYCPQCPRCGTTMKYIFQLDCECNLPFDFGGNGCGHITQCPNHKEIVEFTYECT